MKGGYTRLFDDQASGDKVSEYADAHSTPLPAHITAYHAHASASRHDSEMLSSNFQSKLHLFLAKSIGAKRGESVSHSSTLVLVRNHGKSCNPGKIRDPGASHHFVHAPSIYIHVSQTLPVSEQTNADGFSKNSSRSRCLRRLLGHALGPRHGARRPRHRPRI